MAAEHHTASQTLARFVADLSWDRLPAQVTRRAKDCIVDALANAARGSTMQPWSDSLAGFAQAYGGGGRSRVVGRAGMRLHAPHAALVNGAYVHAFEFDSIRDPSAGIHPGASIVPAALAACEETGRDGREAITAFVAGCEVAFRVAASTHHSPEKLGFHAPALTGPYGAAAAAGHVFGLDAAQMTNAFGLVGSMTGGILAFSKASTGTVVKRLHFGRSAEAGVVAARLAAEGHDGPETVLDGKFGFLEVFARDGEPERLTRGLGRQWETLRICIKRYPCHVNAQPSIQALRELMSEQGFEAEDVSEIVVDCHEALLALHNIPEPQNLMKAQYSVPFSLAIALHRDPDDPASFDDSALLHAGIRTTARERIKLRQREQGGLEAAARAAGGYSAKHARITVSLRDGRRFARDANAFRGMADTPFSEEDLRRKFRHLAEPAIGARNCDAAFERINALEDFASLDIEALFGTGSGRQPAAERAPRQKQKTE
jgi:2-methylcitrate dehydratase PrpD